MTKSIILVLGLLTTLLLTIPPQWGCIASAQNSSKIFVSASPADGTLSVNIDQAPLSQVLDVLSQQTTIVFVVPEKAGDTLISDEFQALPLEAGIRRLLKAQDYLLERLEPTSGKSGQGPMKVRLLGESVPGSSINPVLAGNPADRIAALRELAEQDDPNKLFVVLADAIHDSDQAVRDTALEIMGSMDEEEIPFDLVTEVAQSDPNTELRKEALEVLADAEYQEIEAFLNQMLGDGNSEIRELAAELLENVQD